MGNVVTTTRLFLDDLMETNKRSAAEIKRLEGLVEGRDVEIERLSRGWEASIAELDEERTWRQQLGDLSIDQQVEIERLKASTPMPIEGNVICVRIGGYYTVVPLADSTEAALDQIEGPDWQEVGIRFSRLQRAANRSSQS